MNSSNVYQNEEKLIPTEEEEEANVPVQLGQNVKNEFESFENEKQQVFNN